MHKANRSKNKNTCKKPSIVGVLNIALILLFLRKHVGFQEPSLFFLVLPKVSDITFLQHFYS